tara:strand:+ start:1175 stop:1339 length:165 start_codon:yes stop_codon:yes gene_type:complete
MLENNDSYHIGKIIEKDKNTINKIVVSKLGIKNKKKKKLNEIFVLSTKSKNKSK